MKAKFLSAIKQFICTGNAFNVANYHFTGIRYGYDNEYMLDNWIDFSLLGNNTPYLIMGFGWKES